MAIPQRLARHIGRAKLEGGLLARRAWIGHVEQRGLDAVAPAGARSHADAEQVVRPDRMQVGGKARQLQLAEHPRPGVVTEIHDDERVDDAVLRYTASLGGSISAEHGVGRAKQRWLHLNRSDNELDAFRAVKRALDPEGILNPGVLFC